MTRPRILFLTSGRDVPSTLFRVMEYLPRLRSVAQVSLSPCRPPKDWSRRQIGWGGWPLDFLAFVGKAVSRLTAISRGPLHDLVFLEGELLAAWAPVLETMAMALSPRAILDLSGGIERHHPRAVGAICRRARHVIAGDEAAATFAQGSETRVSVIPTAIDTGRFTPGTRDGKTVVWTGLPEGLPDLAALRARIRQPLRVICTRKPQFECEYVPWSPGSEAEALRTASVGILPPPGEGRRSGLPEVPLLKYMASGLPPVVPPGAPGAECVGETGVVAEDWESGIERAMALDGGAARTRVVERHSVEALFPRWWGALQAALS